MKDDHDDLAKNVAAIKDICWGIFILLVAIGIILTISSLSHASDFKVGTITRDLSAPAGDVFYPLPFKAQAFTFASGFGACTMIGFDDGTSHAYVDVCGKGPEQYGTEVLNRNSIFLTDKYGVNYQKAYVSEIRQTGWVLRWTKAGNPRGVATIIYKAVGEVR